MCNINITSTASQVKPQKDGAGAPKGRIVCGWCPPDNRADLGPADVDGETTGICPACYRRMLESIKLFDEEQQR